MGKTWNRKVKDKSELADEESKKVVVPDGWKPDPFKREDNKACIYRHPDCLSYFATLFPRYREKYIREIWPLVKAKLAEYDISAELDVIEGTMKVANTYKTWDPYVLFRARAMIALIARSVPFEQACRVLEDEIDSDIVNIKNLVSKRESFIRRRQRLIGQDGATLKAIEMLTNCYVLVQGSTVCAIGPFRGIREVKKIVEECMKNIHPVYNIKCLMIKHELAKNPELKDKSWDRFLPKFKKKNITKRKKPKVINTKKEYTPFPPPQLERKVDKELATGEYFLKEKERIKNKKLAKRQQQEEKANQKKRKREEAFIPPEETTYKKSAKRAKVEEV